MTSIKNLSFRYRRKPELFTDLTLELPPGNIYGLLGKNGAGKTTLLKLICGLNFPQAGHCETMGVEASRRSPQMLSETVFIGEEFTLPPVSAKLYLELHAPFYPRFNYELFESARREFELDDDSHLSKMSYGQMKKFLIAFGLATECSLLVLDEPTNGLDIPAKRQFRKLLASNLSPDRTFLISTHQVRDMQNLIDPIIILDEGRVIFNADSFQAAAKISLSLRQSEPSDDVIYYEKVPGGFAVVEDHVDGSEDQLDLELLFNAVISNKKRFAEIFTGNKA